MIKVENTKTERLVKNLIGGNEVDVLVTDAKLVLVECSRHEAVLRQVHGEGQYWVVLNVNGWLNSDDKFYKPIYISETEKIEVGGFAYNYMTKRYGRVLRISQNGDITIDNGQYEDTSSPNNFVKVLALPEHFSPEQLQAIIDGKLKEGSKCLVECEEVINHISWDKELESKFDYEKGYPIQINQIKLNPHITIYPLVEEKMYTRDEVKEIVLSIVKEISYGNEDLIYHYDGDFREAKQWFKQNVK